MNRTARRGSNQSRQLDGFSQSLTRKLEDMDQSELVELAERTERMLNSHIVLPDGGAKLKAKLAQINSLLKGDDMSTNSITSRVSEMSLDQNNNNNNNNKKRDVRKDTVDHANDIANMEQNNTHSNLLRANSLDTDSQQQQQQQQQSSKSVRMISLEESINLQESQLEDLKQAKMKNRMESVKKSIGKRRTNDSLADEISLTMNRLTLDPETDQRRPADDGPSDGEGPDSDDDDDTEEEQDGIEDYERLYDDEGFDEEDEYEDEQHHYRH